MKTSNEMDINKTEWPPKPLNELDLPTPKESELSSLRGITYLRNILFPHDRYTQECNLTIHLRNHGKNVDRLIATIELQCRTKFSQNLLQKYMSPKLKKPVLPK